VPEGAHDAELRVSRYGLVGALAGALIGGLASLSGSYVTFHQQATDAAHSARRSACAELASAGGLDLYAVANLRTAAKESQKDYDIALAFYRATDPKVYPALVSVLLSTDNQALIDAATRVNSTLFAIPLPPARASDLDEAKSIELGELANKALGEFTDACRRNL
jgi:hypothetical protein